MTRTGVILFLLLLPLNLAAQLRLPGPMSDGMVLQRNTEAHIYGSGTPGKTVRVRTSWDKQTYSAVPGPDSLWCVAVRYAFHNLPEGNLTNTLGLPAFPFRTDRWDDVR